MDASTGRALADQLFRAYLHQMLLHGFFHADPHPGNVAADLRRKLALIDLGMVARVPSDMQDALLKLLLAASEGRGEEVADAALALARSATTSTRPPSPAGSPLLVADQHGRRLQDMSAGRVVAELSRIAGECGLRPPPELAMLGKALLNLDDVARALDPSFDPNEAIRDEAASILRQRFIGAPSPGNMAAAAMDAKEFVEKLPGRVNKVMDALAEGELTLNVQGIDEAEPHAHHPKARQPGDDGPGAGRADHRRRHVDAGPDDLASFRLSGHRHCVFPVGGRRGIRVAHQHSGE